MDRYRVNKLNFLAFSMFFDHEVRTHAVEIEWKILLIIELDQTSF